MLGLLYSVKQHCSLYQKCSVGLKYAKNSLPAGARPGPRWGTGRALRLPSRLGTEHPVPNPLRLSCLRHSASVPQYKILSMLLITSHPISVFQFLQSLSKFFSLSSTIQALVHVHSLFIGLLCLLYTSDAADE